MIITWDYAPTGSPLTPNNDLLDFGHSVKEAVIALDKTLMGESGEITVHDRRIKFKAKCLSMSRLSGMLKLRIYMETGIRVKAKHYDTDRDANVFAIRKLCDALKDKGILHDVHDELFCLCY